MAYFSKEELDAFKTMKFPAVQGASTPAAQPPKKKRNFWLDQLSTAGGIVGGIGGSLVAPVVGTAAGAAAGSALGETLENVFDPKSGDWGNVAEEAVLGGVFGGGPLRLGKAALGARAATSAAKKAGTTLGVGQALKQGGKEASEWTLRGAAGKKLTDKSTELATKQFGIQGSFINKFNKSFKEDPGKTLTRYGIASADDMTEQISKQQGVFDTLVESAGNIKKGTIQSKFGDRAAKLSKSGIPEEKALGQAIMKDTDELLAQYGDDIPAPILNQLKAKYDKMAKRVMGQDSGLANKYEEISNTFREIIQEGTGNSQLKQTGKELQKLRLLSDEIGKRAPTVANRNASPLGLRNLLGASIGGGIGFGAGGPAGALAGAALVSGVNSPTGRRAATKGALGLGNMLTKSGDNLGQDGLMGVSKGIAGRMTAGSLATGGLPGAVPDEDESAYRPQDIESALLGAQSPQIGGMGMQGMGNVQGADGFGMGGQAQSPYSRENLLMDIQRDPQNAKDYIAYYTQLAEIFEPASAMGDLSQSSANALASSDNAINTVDQLEDLFTGAGGGSGRIGGFFKDVAADAGFDEQAKVYNSLANASVTQIAKALAGSGAGTVSDMDAKVIMNALPTIRDTPAEARAKFAALRQRLDAAKNNTMMYGGGASQPQTLQDVYSTQGAY